MNEDTGGPSNPPPGAPPPMLPALAAAMGAQMPPSGALPFGSPTAGLGQAPFLFPGAPMAGPPVAAPARPRARGRGGAGDDSDRKRCNCKNSRCLKLYCECFASGRYCDGCNCNNCMNNQSNEDKRHAAVDAILERNPNAFRPKIAATDEGAAVAIAGARHNKGCNCKKSGCLKKYCECFQAGVVCSQNCKCVDCKNFEGSSARAVLVSGGQRLHRGERPSGGPILPPRGIPRGDRGGISAAPAMTQDQRQQAAKDALRDVVSPEVIEKLTMLLMIIANEEADRRAAAGETEDPEPLAEASVPTRSSEQRRASLYDEQERLVLTEIRDTLRTITRVVADKVERRASAASAKQHAAAVVAAQHAAALAAQQGHFAAAAAAAAGRATGGVMASVALPPGVQVPPGMQPMYVVHNNRPQLVFVPQTTLAAAQQQQMAAAAAAMQQHAQAAAAAAAAAAAPMEDD